MSVEDQYVTGVTSDDSLVGMLHARLREPSRYGRRATMRERNDTRRTVCWFELVQHPEQRDRVEVMDAPRRAIRMETLSASPAARVPAVQADCVVAECVSEESPDRTVPSERSPPLDIRCLVIDLDVKSRARRLRRKGLAQLVDLAWMEQGGDNDIPRLAEWVDPGICRSPGRCAYTSCHG